VNTLEIVVIAIVAVLALLALGGAIAQRRRMHATEAQFRARVEQANHDLAQAHAADNGWAPERVEAAARAAFAERAPGQEITQIALVQVIDKPGIEEDEAIFHVETAAGAQRITLGRAGDDWVAR
jgi:hypothetical protein